MPVRPNSHRLRQGRCSENGRAYLVTAAVYRRRRIFEDWRLGRLLVAELRRCHDHGAVNSMAWGVMPDHFHWLFQLEHGRVERVMQQVKSRSTLTINRALQERGAFWQSGYHDRAIRDGQELQPFARYIVANPLRAGLVDRIGDYPLWDACWL
ncbi:REP-associated tyrosine transposase [Pseudomonas sp. NPDC089534]|uniref:REP-associated tyrosine transposase n=1 Tax=Pseudomonas sp. NPDC089534 TaxID=3364468 RepID=UPI0037FE52EB